MKSSIEIYLDTLRSVSEEAKEFFREKHHARENALQLSRQMVQLSSKAIRSAHRGEFDESYRLLESINELMDKLLEIEDLHPDVFYVGFVQDAQKEYSEASATLAFIMGVPLPGPKDLNMSYAPYLNGLGDAIGEMRRYILDCLRRGEISRCEEILGLMDQIHMELFTMDFPEAITGGLRRITDAMRGILERTRADLTIAFRQSELESRLTQIWDDIGEVK